MVAGGTSSMTFSELKAYGSLLNCSKSCAKGSRKRDTVHVLKQGAFSSQVSLSFQCIFLCVCFSKTSSRVNRDAWDEILECKHLTTYSTVYNPCLTFVQIKYILVLSLMFKFLTVTPLTCLMFSSFSIASDLLLKDTQEITPSAYHLSSHQLRASLPRHFLFE